jgi:exodeoxyribonuclease VII large subunit
MLTGTSTVSDLIFAVKNSLEGEFLDVTVEGEITNLSGSAAGHYYFTLSDRNAAVSCALFKMDALRNPIIRRVKNGDKIIIKGPISVYAKRGTFQIIAKRITPFGTGDLKEQFEKLKQKFNALGYFNEEHKKQIPNLPTKIAIITAMKGAALQDFLNIMKRRSSSYDITIIPAVVQGDTCARTVIKGIDSAEKLGNVDVLVIARGGGSLEDLWGFNDEKLVERAFKCTIPIISAIGHQVDFSLLDFVSDLRCETPSSAAEILSQGQLDAKQRLHQKGRELRFLTIELKTEIEAKLHRVNPVNIAPLLGSIIANEKNKLDRINPVTRVDLLGVYEKHQNLDFSIEKLIRNVNLNWKQSDLKINNRKKLLDSLNPHNVLGRGYSYISTDAGKVLASKVDFDAMAVGEKLLINFNDGVGPVQKIKGK